EIKGIEAKEGRLSIELQVVLAFQDVIEDAKAAAHAHLAVGEGVPGEAKAWSKVILVGEVGAFRSSRVTGEKQTGGRIGEYLRIRPQLKVKGPALRVQFGRAVLVAQAKRQRKVAQDLPLIRGKGIIRLAADIGGRLAKLREYIRQSHQEIGFVIVGETSALSIEVELAIHKKVEDRIVLVGHKGKAELVIVVAVCPAHGI